MPVHVSPKRRASRWATLVSSTSTHIATTHPGQPNSVLSVTTHPTPPTSVLAVATIPSAPHRTPPRQFPSSRPSTTSLFESSHHHTTCLAYDVRTSAQITTTCRVNPLTGRTPEPAKPVRLFHSCRPVSLPRRAVPHRLPQSCSARARTRHIGSARVKTTCLVMTRTGHAATCLVPTTTPARHMSRPVSPHRLAGTSRVHFVSRPRTPTRPTYCLP